MPLHAIAREVSPAMNRCELCYLERTEIDVGRAREQHAAYLNCLRDLGVTVTVLPAERDWPDSVFVEDPVVVLDELAVVARLGAESRRGEAESLAAALAPFRPLRRMQAPATLEGGDVFRVERTLYVGQSQRTNAAGIEQLRNAVGPLGYEVRPVGVGGCLHLKSGACYLGRGIVLANREWIDPAPFRGFRVLEVEEPWAADVLAIGDTVLMPAGFPRTAALIEREGFRVTTVDISELQKAEAGVTCMSVIFDHSGTISR